MDAVDRMGEQAGDIVSRHPLAEQRRCILVLGMHRSGTSALTRVLNLMGAAVPADVISADAHNKAGYWEPSRLNALHEKMLAEAGSRWDDWRAFNFDNLAGPRRRFYRSEILKLLEQEYGRAPLFVLKEPRICRFVPLYADILASVGVDTRYILPLRNPLAVAASLTKRDGFTPHFGTLLWLRHELDAECATRGKPRVFVSYDGMLEDWRPGLKRITEGLSLAWPRSSEETADAIDAHFTKEHQNHVANDDQLNADTRIAGLVKDVHAALTVLEADPDDAGAMVALDQARSSFENAARVLGDGFYAELDARLENGRRIAAHERNAELGTRIVELDVGIAKLDDRAAELDTRIAQLDAGIAELDARTAQLHTNIARLDASIAEFDVSAELHGRNAELDAEVARISEDQERLQSTLDAVYGSTSWRITGPLRALRRIGSGCSRLGQSLREGTRAITRKGAEQVARLPPPSEPPHLPATDRVPQEELKLEAKPGSDMNDSGFADAAARALWARQEELSIHPAPTARPEAQAGVVQVKPTVVAFYLPQFHPMPENDKWWGKGFTEWTNVTKASPLFEGHYQPHLPTDLGFYDLRVRETQHDQIALAKQYGIDAFCFHYYWFNGKRLLDKPVDAFLPDKSADISFCLCWANENWTRRWDGAEKELLIAQQYEPGWREAFIDSIAPFLRDERYLRVRGKPLLVVYAPQRIPDTHETVLCWRDYCRRIGIGEIHMVAALTHGNEDYSAFGFDAGVQFPPHNFAVRNFNDVVPVYEPFQGFFVEYGDMARFYLGYRYEDRPVYRTVFPSWDNTARVKNRALVVLGASPDNYERWLRSAIHLTQSDRAPDEQLVFVNAWNEWAEGCHLEPDRKFGKGYLEATLRAKHGMSRVNDVFTASPFSKRELPKVTSERMQRHEWRRRVQGVLSRFPPALSAARAVYRGVRRVTASARCAQGHQAPGDASPVTKLKNVPLAESAPALSTREAFLGASGDAVFTAFPAKQVVFAGDVHIEEQEGLRNAANLRQFFAEPSYLAQPFAFGKYHECTVHPHAILLITKDGKLITETARVYGFVDPGYKQLSHLRISDGEHTQLQSAVHVLDEQVIFPVHPGLAFGHCIFDAIPQLLFWEAEIKRGQMKIGLSDAIPPWFQDMLGMWGFVRQHFLVLPREPMLLRSAIVCTALTSLTTYYPHTETIRLFRNSLPALDAPSRPARLYITRDNTTTFSAREVENEEEVIAAVKALGFRVVDPSKLPYTEQRRLFASADMIVGVHGSAFANIIWCREGTKIVDLMPDDWFKFWGTGGITENWLARLTRICGLEYNLLLCNSSMEQRRIRLVVDIRKLMELLPCEAVAPVV
jgi:capsular polysaccharide biosynthesis protein